MRTISRSLVVRARPMRCSTVTPGKFATFWRSPVRRLNKVDFPEFGGPMMATTCERVALASFGGSAATAQLPQLWQSLMASEFSLRLCWKAGVRLGALQFRGEELLPIHRLDRRAALRRARCGREPRHGRARNRVPLTVEPHLPEDPIDR